MDWLTKQIATQTQMMLLSFLFVGIVFESGAAVVVPRKKFELSSSAAMPNPTSILPFQQVAWLHVPKAGTSFANVLMTWACPLLGDNASVSAHAATDTYVGDFLEAHADCAPPGICGGHHTLSNERCNNWERHKGHFVGMFRQPAQRLLSGYGARQKAQAYDVATYARFTEGCVVRMLNGLSCPEYSHPSGLKKQAALNQSLVKSAIKRIDQGFAFVGLTEEWDLSVCLFHAMFGGSCHPREFENTRPGTQRLAGTLTASGSYNASVLGDWEDPYDEPVYAHARDIFWKNIHDFGVNPDTCRREICADAPAQAFTGY